MSAPWMVGIGKPRLPRSADLMKMGLICGFSGMYLFFFFKYRVPQGGGLTDVSYSLGTFAGDGTAGFMTSFRPQTQFCLELSNTPFDNGVPFPGVQFHGAGHPHGHSSSCPTMDCGLSHISGLYDSGVSHGCWHVWTSACHRKANFKINILGLP